jgi:hypothetical protein
MNKLSQNYNPLTKIRKEEVFQRKRQKSLRRKHLKRKRLTLRLRQKGLPRKILRRLRRLPLQHRCRRKHKRKKILPVQRPKELIKHAIK